VIGFATTVLERYLMQDDPRQSARATPLIESLTPEAHGHLPLVAMVELLWAPLGGHALSRAQVATVLDTLLRRKELVVDRAGLVIQTLQRFSAGNADFADALIERIANAAGCKATMSFDMGAVKAGSITLVP